MGNYSAAVFYRARAEFGLPTLSQANFAMVRKFFNDQFREHRVRISHMWRVNALASAFFTVVTSHDRHAYAAITDKWLREEYAARSNAAIPRD
jgi:hypothetical protein